MRVLIDLLLMVLGRVGGKFFQDEHNLRPLASEPEIERKQTIGCFNQNTESNFPAKTLNMKVTKNFRNFIFIPLLTGITGF